jgi:hypothetical protein
MFQVGAVSIDLSTVITVCFLLRFLFEVYRQNSYEDYYYKIPGNLLWVYSVSL